MTHNDSSTNAAQRRVEECLKKSLMKNYGRWLAANANYSDANEPQNWLLRLIKTMLAKKTHLDDVTQKILRIHGLTKEHLDVIGRFEDEMYAEGGLTDNSIDSNANKNMTNTRALLSDVMTGPNKIIGYRYLYREMKTIYGGKRAQELMGLMYDYSLAINDSTNILIPYCFAMDASSLITIGRKFGQLPSGPVKRLSSYISVLNEVCHSFTNQIAGALAVGTFFLDSAFILNNLENIPLDVLRENPELVLQRKDGTIIEKKNNISIRKYVENCFQSFVHSMNSLTRLTYESPFTNISIFSPSKIRGLISEEGRNWYLDATTVPGKPDATREDKINYMIEYIVEVQNIFMDFFDKGDPINGGQNYRFPVVTINVSKEVCGTAEDGSQEFKIVDEDNDFVDSITKREIYRYNNMVSTGTKIASCCRLITNVAELNEFGAHVNSFGGTATSYGSHRVVTINFPRIAIRATSIQNFIDNECDLVFAAVQILHAHRKLLKFTCSKKNHPFFANGWMHLDRLFSTIGVIGIGEAADIIIAKIKSGIVPNTTQFKINKNLSKDEYDKNLAKLKDYLIEQMLTTLNARMKHYSEETSEYRNPFNIEQVPGETMAVRLCDADKLIFGDDAVPYELYSNQAVPLWEDANIWERMKQDGKFNQMYSGGGICHFNIGERPTPEQVRELYEYSVKTGCEHFALNPIYSQCENNHFNFGKFEECPVCKAKIKEYFTRVVGFYVPVSGWNKVRREWEFPKRKFMQVKDIEITTL